MINRQPTFSDARDNREVAIFDVNGKADSYGRLQYLSKNSNVATVVVDGRRVRAHADWVRVVSTHLTPDDSQLMPCCQRPVVDLRPLDRLTTNRSRVTCPNYWSEERA